MMAFAELLASPLAQRWAMALVHFLWQGLLVAGLLVVLLKILRAHGAQARYAACLTGMVVAAACPVVTFALIEAGPGSGKLADEARGRVPDFSSAPFAGFTEPSGTDPAFDTVPAAPTHRTALAHREKAASLRAVCAAHVRRAQPWVVLLWITGVFALSGRLLLGAAGIRRLKRHVQPIPAEIAACARRLGRQLGMMRPPPVYVSTTVKLWDPNSGELKRSLSHPDDGGEFVPIESVAFSPDGHLLATATAAFVKGAPESIGGTIRSLPSGEKATALTPAEWSSSVCSSSPVATSQRLLASASDDKTVRVWDLSGSRTSSDD